MPLLGYICAKMFALDNVVAIGVVAMGCAPGTAPHRWICAAAAKRACALEAAIHD